MRLCEAIRKGCEALPVQAVGDYFSKKTTLSGVETSACALGAAVYSLLGEEVFCVEDLHSFTALLRAKFEVLEHETIKCPGDEKCDYDKRPAFKKKHRLMGLIIHLNDDHLWTREQIADLIERHYENNGTENRVASRPAVKVG
jgi:hypothetical protein